MPVEVSHFAAFLMGLISTFHCWGMCGGIIGALSLNIPKSYNHQRWKRILITAGYNLGRISSYVLAGIFTATAGFIVSSAAGHDGHAVLPVISGAVLVFLGLRIAGWLYPLPFLERLGGRLWQWIQPLAKPFLPVDRFYKALLVGGVWGWLPCGLVYSVLLWSALTANPVYGATYMLAFGLGTLPGMFLAGLFAHDLSRLRQVVYLKRIAGVLVIGFGLLSLSLPFMSSH